MSMFYCCMVSYLTDFTFNRDTADALLRHEETEWRTFMAFSAKARKGKKTLYPLMMLIKEMPGVYRSG